MSEPVRIPVMVEVRRRLPASPERVFDAFLDPARAGRFLFSTPEGEMVRVEIDARVGGRYLFVDRRDGEDVEHTGQYLEIDRPRRLAFTFLVPKYSDTPATVVITFAPAGEDCDLVLTQEMPAAFADYAEPTRQGWAKILDRLAGTLPDPV